MNRLSNEALIRLYLQTSNNQYFAQLYTRHRYRVHKLCLRFCKDPNEADDLTQEIFMQLLQKIGSFRGESSFITWLRAVTTNYCLTECRKQQQKIIQQGTYTKYNAEHGYEEAEFRSFQVMEQAIEQLSAYHQNLLRVKYSEGLATQTIAQQQKVTDGAIKMRLKRAKEQANYLYVKLYADAG